MNMTWKYFRFVRARKRAAVVESKVKVVREQGRDRLV